MGNLVLRHTDLVHGFRPAAWFNGGRPGAWVYGDGFAREFAWADLDPSSTEVSQAPETTDVGLASGSLRVYLVLGRQGVCFHRS